MSIDNEFIKKDGYDSDPTDVSSFQVPSRKKGICGICFDEIKQPLINGIWYHKWTYKDSNHTPIPATPTQQLFWINGKSKSRYEASKTGKKCKKHERYWNDFIDMPKIRRGMVFGHYYDENGIAKCGRLMGLDRRDNVTTPKRLKEKHQGMSCKKCINSLEKEGILKITQHDSLLRGLEVRWLK